MVATRRSSRISSAASSSLSAAKENPPTTSKRTHVSDSESGLSPLSESEGEDSGEDSNVPLIVRNGKKPASGTGKKRATKKVKLEVEISDKAPASTSSEDTETPGSFDMDQEADTPATTISSRASTVAPKWKGKGKAVEPPTINAVTRRLSGRLSKNIEEITDSQDELDEEDDSDDDLSYGEDMEDDETDDFESDIEAAVEIISAADNGLIAGPSIAAPLSLPPPPPPPPPPPIFRTARRTRVRQPARARAHTPWQSRSDRERAQLYYHHPDLKTIWDELGTRPKISVEKDPQPDGLSLTMLPFQREGLHWLRLQEQSSFRGGILADEMGMGKTIQTIALLMTQPRMKPNLVVAPTVALMQWRSEIEKYTNGALKVVIFHGANRESSAKELAKFDVVMTTYSVLESCYRKQHTGFKRKAGLFKEPSVLHSVDFHRVVLDEAHNIKDRSCNTAKAVFNLKTKFKLCLSGTPLQNRIGELFSLLRFLEADPFSYYYCRNCPCKSLHWKFSDNRSCDKCGHRPMSHVCFFNNDLLKPIQNHGSVGPGRTAFENLQKLLGHIMLRRTKLERADDLGLPPRVVKIRRDYFNEEELDLYDSIYGESKRKFNTYVSQGVVLNNYANIFTLITRMRQLADHPDLVLRKHSEEGQNTLVCALCDDEAEEAIKSRCHHTFCRLCVQKYIDGFAGWEEGKDEPDCPTCHITLNIDMTQPSIEGDYATIKKNSIINRINMSNWRSSTKIEALVEELYKLRSRTSTIKSIVFSQFTSMLQLVEWRLRRAGFSTVMLEGSMSPIQREATIKHFMNTTEVEVFLVSLKAGGVALNLIEASQVFIMDPWWNPSVEWQAADRIHRIGQNRVCNITRLVIEDSIESRIVDLQEKKARMIHATVGGDQKAMERLTPADMQFLFQN